MNYQYYSLVTMTLNTKGNAEIVLEKLTKEVDGVVVPCTKEESIFKYHDKLSKTGGNANVQSIKCILLDPTGGRIDNDEVVKPVVAE